MERAASLDHDDDDEGIEEAFSEETGGVDAGEGITVARALYSVQKGSEWSVGQAQVGFTPTFLCVSLSPGGGGSLARLAPIPCARFAARVESVCG